MFGVIFAAELKEPYHLLYNQTGWDSKVYRLLTYLLTVELLIVILVFRGATFPVTSLLLLSPFVPSFLPPLYPSLPSPPLLCCEVGLRRPGGVLLAPPAGPGNLSHNFQHIWSPVKASVGNDLVFFCALDLLQNLPF